MGMFRLGMSRGWYVQWGWVCPGCGYLVLTPSGGHKNTVGKREVCILLDCFLFNMESLKCSMIRNNLDTIGV